MKFNEKLSLSEHNTENFRYYDERSKLYLIIINNLIEQQSNIDSLRKNIVGRFAG